MKILSLGLGVQSTGLYYMSSIGVLPRLDYAIFSDLGAEKKKTYQYLDFLLSWQKKNNGVPIIIRKDRNLYQDLLHIESAPRFTSIPAFICNEEGKAGMLKRQCTDEYKVNIVNKAIRELYGLNKHERTPATEIWKGISLDELNRINEPRRNWQKFIYPYIGYMSTREKGGKTKWMKIEPDLRMSRSDIESWYLTQNLPVPPKSACLFCPYQSEYAWYDLKQNDPEDFQAAILLDQAIRDSTKRGINRPVYLHESLQPLSDVQFDLSQPDLFKGECSGTCHL
jgi:hypothetical protein